MIPHADFARLRLVDFLPETSLAQLRDWEFQDHVWVGEALGFSEWLRLQDDPEVLRSLALDLSEFPTKAAEDVLHRLDLPIRKGMSVAQLDTVLGRRVSETRFVADRLSFDYLTLPPSPYRIQCTVLDKGGLSYVVVMVPPIGDEPKSSPEDLGRPA